MTIAKTVEAGLNIRKISRGLITWLDVVEPGLAEMEYLRRNFNFHQLALEGCLSQVQLPKLDNYDEYLFLVLHFPRFRHETRLTRPVQVNFFVSGEYIVTVHPGELQPLFKLFSDCDSDERVRNSVFGHNTGYLLYRILSDLIAYMFPVLNKVIEAVDELEAKIFEPTRTGVLTRSLSFTRRDILAFRRIVSPQIPVMEFLESTQFPFLRVNPDVYFGDLADSMRRIHAELNDLREVIEGLNDTHLTLTSLHTGEVIRILTVIFTITIPLTLVAALYGMDVRLPLGTDQDAFWIILAATGLTTIGMLIFFRLRYWF